LTPAQITRTLRKILDRHCGALSATEVVALTEAHNYIDRRDFRDRYIDHIDGNRRNNDPRNIRIVTAPENLPVARRRG
jgi:hypothetical protein